MKRLWLGAAMWGWVAGAGEVGTVNFANGAAGVDAPVRLASTGERLAGERWTAELHRIEADGSSRRVLGPATLAPEGLAGGYFFGGMGEVEGSQPGEEVTLKVVVREIGGWGRGESNPVRVTLGGGTMPPPNLVGLEQMTVVAEPPALKVQVHGPDLALTWPALAADAVLESSPSLSAAEWTVVAVEPEATREGLTVMVPGGESERYFRLRLPLP
ncbi:MAG: hypothetical protein KF833_00205 [Verrucomicrobiae bacterium]|nr:hypothetical protein [Verrucomicrobiae bacterium]